MGIEDDKEMNAAILFDRPEAEPSAVWIRRQRPNLILSEIYITTANQMVGVNTEQLLAGFLNTSRSMLKLFNESRNGVESTETIKLDRHSNIDCVYENTTTGERRSVNYSLRNLRRNGFTK